MPQAPLRIGQVKGLKAAPVPTAVRSTAAGGALIVLVAALAMAFSEADLLTNIRALVDALNKAKPSGAKGTYVKRISLSSTMGPGVKVDTASVGG